MRVFRQSIFEQQRLKGERKGLKELPVEEAAGRE